MCAMRLKGQLELILSLSCVSKLFLYFTASTVFSNVGVSREALTSRLMWNTFTCAMVSSAILSRTFMPIASVVKGNWPISVLMILCTCPRPHRLATVKWVTRCRIATFQSSTGRTWKEDVSPLASTTNQCCVIVHLTRRSASSVMATIVITLL